MISNRFDNLSDSEEWKSVENLYKENQAELSVLQTNLVNKYGFSKVLAEDSILYELSGFVYNENTSFKNFFFFNLLLFYTIFLFLVLIFPILFVYRIFRKKYAYAILFEEMWDSRSLYSRFYKGIYNHIKSKDIALLLTSPNLKKETSIKNIEGWNDNVVDTRMSNLLYDYKIVYKIFKNDYLFGVTLFKASNKVNLLYIYLRLLRRMLMHSSQVDTVSSKVIISAVDYYWNPIKYFYYKKNIDKIVLIQHNHKYNYLYGRALMYCDNYFAHSTHSIDKISINQDSVIKSIGSLQVYDFIKNSKDKLKYDILFINQTVNDNLKDGTPLLDQDLLIKSHSKLIDNFTQYLNKNKDIKVVYMTKPTYMEVEPAKSIRKSFDTNKNIDFFSAYGKSTFDLVSKSKVIINMYSSVGREAYGMDKKVLWVNYDNCCSLFDLDIAEDDIHTLVTDNSYQAFEERINLLLSDDKEVDNHYKKLKEKYMNIQENPAKIIAAKINEILEK